MMALIPKAFLLSTRGRALNMYFDQKKITNKRSISGKNIYIMKMIITITL